jgi:hypothetical protein
MLTQLNILHNSVTIDEIIINFLTRIVLAIDTIFYGTTILDKYTDTIN